MKTKEIAPKVGGASDLRITLRDEESIGILDIILTKKNSKGENFPSVAFDYYGGSLTASTSKETLFYSMIVGNEEEILNLRDLLNGELNQGTGAIIADNGSIVTINRMPSSDGNGFDLLFLSHRDVKGFKKFTKRNRLNWKYAVWQLLLPAKEAAEFIAYFNKVIPNILEDFN